MVETWIRYDTAFAAVFQENTTVGSTRTAFAGGDINSGDNKAATDVLKRRHDDHGPLPALFTERTRQYKVRELSGTSILHDDAV